MTPDSTTHSAACDVVLRQPEVTKITGLPRSSIYAAEGFPTPIKIGPRASGWLLSEVRAWLAQRVAERDAKVQP